MPTIQSSIKHWACIVLAIWMAVGGISGLWVLKPALSTQVGLPVAALIAFFVGNIAAGWLLWKKPRWGLSLTLVLQLLQLLRIHGPTVDYMLASVAGFWVMPTDGGIGFPWNLGSSFYFSRITGFGPSIPTGSTSIGVNLVAIAVAASVWVLWPNKQGTDTG